VIPPEELRKIAGNWLTGVAVVTTVDGQGKPHGMTMNAVTSLSLEPPQFLICIDRKARTLDAIRESACFCINYLAENQQDLAAQFARRGGDRFSQLEYQAGKTGAPILAGTIAHVECRLRAVHPGGDHGIVVGNAVHGAATGGDPLVYFRGQYRKLPP
jgi:flavin reductase (DIM6/NTAB) family NADH-FMN oxidoreductase RutF